MYLEALVRLPGVSGWIACCFQTDIHFADAWRFFAFKAGGKGDLSDNLNAAAPSC